MKLLLIATVSALSLLAAEQPAQPKSEKPAPAAAPAPSGSPLAELEALKFENLNLQKQLADAQMELAKAKDQIAKMQVQFQQNEVLTAACSQAKVPLAECTVDLQTRTVKRTPPPEKAPAK